MSIKSAMREMRFGMPDTAPKPQQTTNNSSTIQTHLQNALTSHKSGDHTASKKHALKAVNMLHALTSAAPSGGPPAAGGAAGGAAAC